MDHKDILRKTAIHLNNHGWTQHTAFRDANGNPVLRLDQAVSFCMLGSMLKVLNEYAIPNKLKLKDRATDHFEKTIGTRLVLMNDNPKTTKEDCVKALYLSSRRTGWKIIDFFIR